MASVLVVCTGNVCRSPIAEGMLRARLEARLGSRAPLVASGGTAGWEGSGADPAAVAAAAERGVDIAGHRARRLGPEHIAGADLVLAMAREHREAVASSYPEAAGRTFTLKELVRLLGDPPAEVGDDPDQVLPARVAAADRLRRTGFEGDPADEDVADPLGMPLEAFRAIAEELDDWCGRLAGALFGWAPERAGAGG